MKPYHAMLSMLGLGLLATGCSPTTAIEASTTREGLGNAQASALPTNTTPKEWMDHPEFVNWNQFPLETTVIRKRVVTNAFGTVKVTTRLRLAEKSATAIGVGNQVDVERPGEETEVNPEMILRSPSRFQIPQGMSRDVFLLPSAKAQRVDETVLEISGRAFPCQVYEWEDTNEAGPMTVRLWRSKDMPGRIVRQEMRVLSSDTQTVEEVDRVEIPTEARATPMAESTTRTQESRGRPED
jgi:hypothetical protein